MSNLIVNHRRKHFGLPADQCPTIPFLIKIQVDSYNRLLQQDIMPEQRENIGIQNVFLSNFPVVSQNGNVIVRFVAYHIDQPNYTPLECKSIGNTYAGSLKITLEMSVKEDDIDYVKQQDVYIGEVPFMTDNATFIVNGSERIVVSQLHRSPGLFFELVQSEISKVYTARIIPTRGAWLDFEVDERQQIFCLVNKKRIHATTLLMCLVDENPDRGDKEKVLDMFYECFTFTKEDAYWKLEITPELLSNISDRRFTFDLLESDKTNIFCYADTIVNVDSLAKRKEKSVYVTSNTLTRMELYSDIVVNGKVLAESCETVTQKMLDSLPNGYAIKIVDSENKYGKPVLNSLKYGKCASKTDAVLKLYSVIRPNEQPRINIARAIIENTFFSEDRYSLSTVGRVKLNHKLGLNTESTALSPEDIFLTVKRLLLIVGGTEEYDDPDGLEFRRVRSAGELVKNQFQQAINKFARSIHDRLSSVTKDTSILELVNSRHFISSIREFFGTSELSQLADQTNLLSELSHKRRLSSFGRGGLDRARASTEVRDLHPTHYGKICAIETPEGQAIGLVNSLTIFSKIDEYGFITTPYRPVKNRKILDEIIYLSAAEEPDKIIAHYDRSIFEKSDLLKEGLIHCRHQNDNLLTDADQVEYIDISPKQILSISSSLIPFLENNDATRAVLGANMQRQALPLIEPTAPLIGTGMEKIIVRDSGTCIKSKYNGIVQYSSAEKIIVHNTDQDCPLNSVYTLIKFDKSNDGTVMDQVPCVKVGDTVSSGEIIANGSAIDNGEVALGRNVRIAFHSWKGGNFEDAVIISSKLAKDFSSIGLSKFEISTREIKQGIEQFTRDIPNINEEFINQLDECGIINIGTEVKPGDILVGRVTPKGETNMTPDERLLRAIFGAKSIDVKDTSLRVPPGMRGTVVDVRIFTRKGVDKSPRALQIESETLKRYVHERDLELRTLRDSFIDSAKQVVLSTDQSNRKLDPDVVANWTVDNFLRYESTSEKYYKLQKTYRQQKLQIENEFNARCKRLAEGDALPVGVLETIQVFIATEYVIQPGDKIAGRHGNKGIISKVMNPEDMPFTKDGEIIDMLFTSTGISGRMNIGQVLETHLGWASLNLGKMINEFLEKARREELYVKQLRDFLLLIYDSEREQEMINSKNDDELVAFSKQLRNGVPFASPVFEGPTKEKIESLLCLAKCDPSGKEELYDGQTGLKFPQKVAVGVMYVMQLHHLVEKKEHARSVGPYSLVTQQPIGGKAQMGGQRFGEMEVWTLQAYAAAYTTRETLTVKSDYPIGRARIFELISQGYDIFDQKGIPESFCVLLYELRALCLNVDCLLFRDGKFIPQDLIGIENFDALKISIASPAQIRSWSYGEVLKPETIHYRTSKPNPDGIFSTRIFGPIKDYQCLCGKHRGTKRKGLICSKCGTEVTTSRVRRYRMGHIELAAPVAHIWFCKVLPSRIAIVLDMSITNLNKILKFENYAVITQGLSPYPVGHVLSEHEYNEAMSHYEDNGFEALTGAEALEALLKNLNLSHEIDRMRSELAHANEGARMKLIRRLKILESFHKNGSKPEYMILRVMPVLPPDLRPLVAIEGGRFASSDLNDLYRRIINRNNRLGRLLKYSTPDIIIRNEKRMLQEAVDGLFDNSRQAQPITNTSNKRALKSLACALKGKTGRFRQNLLGKRVDYSGRSVIVVGPHLKLHQCGLPKTMALELFKPFVLARLVLRGFAPTLRIAKTLIENKQAEVWDILAEVTKNHVVLINRAPTLHRLGIQAFEPVLIEGRAIQLHPLTCKAFNADFDGDQVGVHIPLSIESQLEARLLMMSTKCILNPSNGIPIATPTKDIVLGLYALTCVELGFGNEDLVIASLDEAEHALSQDMIRHTTPIKALVDGKIAETTYGRMKLYSILPKHPQLTFDLVNRTMTTKEVQNLVYICYLHAGEEATALFLDDLMRFGFQHATLCGATFSYSDLPVPAEKKELIATTNQMIAEYQKQFTDGLIREEERHNKVIAAWSKCADTIAEKLMTNLSQDISGQMQNPIYMIAASGARGSPLQLRQLAAMRGLIARSDGSVQESPIINSFIEGMTVREYILAAQGARKGLSDIALKTADSGYLARRLADTAQDCITQSDDCGTTNGIELTSLTRSGNTIMRISDRAFGRTLAEDVLDENGHKIASAGDIIDTEIAQQIEENEIISIKVRSPITCQHSGAGICCKCYGYDLSNLKPVKKHVAVGIIAAQSIGEPGTQLTMKNFQSGGAAQNILSDSRIISICNGTIVMPGIKVAEVDGEHIVISRNNVLSVLDNRGRTATSHRIAHGAKIVVNHNQKIQKGDLIAEWDPYIMPIIAEKGGIVKFKDLTADVSFNEVIDHNTGLMKFVVKHTTERFAPTLILACTDGTEIKYTLLPNDSIEIENGAQVKPGQMLAQRTQNIVKTQDIIGGLPLIGDLFEARVPKNLCIMSEIDGIAEIVRTTPQKIIIRGNGMKKEYNIPKNVNIIVESGDEISVGDYLTDGRPSIHDILNLKGPEVMSRYFTDEVQNVYQMQGITISDKHIEIILRQMLGSAAIVDSGDTIMLRDDIARIDEINKLNAVLQKMGKNQVEFKPVLNGISKAAICEKTSFFAAASFQETARRLITAAVRNEIDCLTGMKETLITGQLIPAGIGGVIREVQDTLRRSIESTVSDAAAKDQIV